MEHTIYIKTNADKVAYQGSEEHDFVADYLNMKITDQECLTLIDGDSEIYIYKYKSNNFPKDPFNEYNITGSDFDHVERFLERMMNAEFGVKITGDEVKREIDGDYTVEITDVEEMTQNEERLVKMQDLIS